VEIRHIRAVIAVADAHGVRKTDARLYVAQSALSRTIRDLEREIGVGLFEHRVSVPAFPDMHDVLPASNAHNGLHAVPGEINRAVSHARGACPPVNPVWSFGCVRAILTEVVPVRQLDPTVTELTLFGKICKSTAQARRKAEARTQMPSSASACLPP
jgi:hypothetical protein